MNLKKIFSSIRELLTNKKVKSKIMFTLGALIAYRVLVFLPVPFIDISQYMSSLFDSGSASNLGFFSMLLGGSLDNFSIIGVGLAPYINASIIIQLLTAVIPHLEDLQEQGEAGTQKIQQYTRWASLPLAFLQSFGMVYFINTLLGRAIIDTSSFSTVFMAAFVLTVGSVMMMWVGELITERGISNGTSLLIFASIVSGISTTVYTSVAGASDNVFGVIVTMLVVLLVLMVLSIFILKSIKQIPIIYAKQGKVQQSASLPIPLNPVGMIPIIFAIAFSSFPYIFSQIVTKFGSPNSFVMDAARWIEVNFNIYSKTPSILTIVVHFTLIIAFTFFYSVLVFNPEKMADNIQKRGGYIPGHRPGDETATYLTKTISHLCFRGGIGLGLVGIYSYLLYYLPFIDLITQSLGSMPVIVTGSSVIIIIGVVQDVINKVNAELVTQRYDSI